MRRKSAFQAQTNKDQTANSQQIQAEPLTGPWGAQSSGSSQLPWPRILRVTAPGPGLPHSNPNRFSIK